MPLPESAARAPPRSAAPAGTTGYELIYGQQVTNAAALVRRETVRASVCARERVRGASLNQERDWIFFAEPAPAPYLAHPGGCAALAAAPAGTTCYEPLRNTRLRALAAARARVSAVTF